MSRALAGLMAASRAVVGTAGTILMLSACSSSLFDSKLPSVTTYIMAPASPSTPSTTPLNVDLAVGVPQAAPGLDTERIAVLHDARRLDYYQGAQWGATAQQVMQAFLVTSLQNQQLFRSVTAEQARVSVTHLLDFQLRDFQAEYAKEGIAPTVRVTIVASLIRLKDRKLLASLPITIAVVAQENRLGSVVAAFESAARQIAAELAQQTITALARE